MNWPVLLFVAIAMAGSALVGAGIGWTAARGQSREAFSIVLLGVIFALVCASIAVGMTTPGAFTLINVIH